MPFLRTAIRALLLVTTTGLALAGTLAAPASAATLDGSESDLLGAINSFRASKGLSTLVVSDTLTVAAKWMATDMSVNNYFGHTSLDGRTPQQRMGDAGYPAYANWTGENIAAGYTVANDVLNGWINSPGHYAVLTNANYRAIGIGRAYASGSTYQWYWDADFGGAIAGLDVLYQTRIQAERFESAEEYERYRGVYVVTAEVMQRLPEHAILMHPLPRLGEIDPLVDADPRSAYFRQARNGLWVRMAVLDWAMAR